VRSFAGIAAPDEFDLRRRKDAKALERALDAVDVSVLEGGEAEPPGSGESKRRPGGPGRR